MSVSLITDTENQSLRKIESDSSVSLGQYGATYKNNTGTLDQTVGPWAAIQALQGTVVVELETGSTNWDGSGTGTVDIPLGATIFGNFTKIRLVSGKIVAYKQLK
jgi:hypothetical protein